MLSWAREHRTLAALAVLLVVCVASEGVLWGKLADLRERASSEQERLREMEKLASRYEALQERAARASRQLRDPAVFDIAAVTGAAARQNVHGRIAGTPQASSAVQEDGLVRREVELKLVGVTRKSLVDFLQAVEGLDPAVRTAQLRITPNEAEPQLIDAEICFSARAASVSTQR